MKLALLGDMAFFGAYNINENRQLLERLDDISEYLAQFDCVVGNLETPFSIKKSTHGAKSAYICTDVENVTVLKKLHLNAVCLSNNHMFDFGEEGYQCTLDILQKSGVGFFGVDGKEFVFADHDNKLLFSGFCCFSSSPLQVAKEYGMHGVNAYNIETVSNLINAKQSEGYLNVVAVHAGIEHINYPHIDHVLAARHLADKCPYVYYGHHPHVIQGVEEYNGSIIAHSLGNFCFDDVYSSVSDTPLVELSENNRTGVIIELEIDKNKIIGWKETIIKIGKDGKISILKDITSLVLKYNEALANCLSNQNYSIIRNRIIQDRIDSRKAQRDIKWYLKRLRFRYAMLFFEARINKKQYFANVKKYIS